MLPLEFVATPAASPRCMSGGSLMKFGTESNCSSGADVDCANADGLSSTKSPVSHGLMRASLATVMGWTCWLFRRCASIQTVTLATQSARGARRGVDVAQNPDGSACARARGHARARRRGRRLLQGPAAEH